MAVERDVEREKLRGVEEQIVAGAQAAIPGWVVRSLDQVVTAWGRCTDAELARVSRDGGRTGQRAAMRVASDLRELFAVSLAVQRSTPLLVARSAFREPTVLLVELGIPGVVRDPFDERLNPEDIYDLSPRSMADMGDSELGPLLLAWGLTKARILQESVKPNE